MRHPRTLADFRRHPLVEDVSDERASEDGIWIYLVPGWCREHGDPVHSVHEDTVKDCSEYFRCIVECPCDECARLKAEAAARR